MLEFLILVNRPIVVTPQGTELCRPSQTVRTLLARLAVTPKGVTDDVPFGITSTDI